MNTQQPVSDPQQAVEPLEEARATWLRIDILLRRLATRLTYAADGRTDALDSALGPLRQQLREPLVEDQLESVLLSLTEAVRSLDASPAVSAVVRVPIATPVAPAAVAPPTKFTAVTSNLLLGLMDRLKLGDADSKSVAAVRQAIVDAADEAELAVQAEAMACMVNRYHRELGEQHAAAEQLLAHVTSQLDELARYLDQESIDRRDGSGARHELDSHLQDEIVALGDHLQQSRDISSLHVEVQSRLGAITGHLKTFREREEARERDWQVRSEQMSQRIGELERSAQTMEVRFQQKHQLASTDTLTGIANRLVFEQHMAQLCEQLARQPSDACLLVLDIDHFKKVNDRFGHAAGDRALRIVAEQLAKRLRADDLLARYGGEEFVVVLPDTTADAALALATELLAGIEGVGFRGQQQPVRITLSCGITALRSGDTPAEAFDRADRAMYRAKNGGRNRCEVL